MSLTPHEERIRKARRNMLDVPQWLQAAKGCGLSDQSAEEESYPLHFGIRASEQELAEYSAPLLEPVSATRVQTASVLHFPRFPVDCGAALDTPCAGRQSVGGAGPEPLLFQRRTPQTLAVFSLPGGTGRTTIAVNLVRILAGHGRRVLLADAAIQGLRPHLDARHIDLVILDLSGASLHRAAKVLRRASMALIPILPTAHSLLHLQTTVAFLRRCQPSPGVGQRRYVLTQFDKHDPCHLTMQERFQQVLGHEMLPVTVRASHLVEQALAVNRTVVDLAPASLFAKDLRQLAATLGLTGLDPSPLGQHLSQQT